MREYHGKKHRKGCSDYEDGFAVPMKQIIPFGNYKQNNDNQSKKNDQDNGQSVTCFNEAETLRSRWQTSKGAW